MQYIMFSGVATIVDKLHSNHLQASAILITVNDPSTLKTKLYSIACE